MKKILFFISFLLVCVKLQAQSLPPNFNLVSNPSFEFNSFVIGDTDFTNNKFCWIRANKHSVEITDTNFSSFGGKSIHSGQTAILFSESFGDPFSTNPFQWIDTSGYCAIPYFETKLLEPLIAGATYYFTLYAGIIKDTRTAAAYGNVLGNIGIYFSTSKLANYTTSGRINVTPQIRFVNWDIPLFDTFMYTKLTTTYTAIGGEQYITIGNFDYFAQYHYVFLKSPPIVYQGDFFNQPLIDDISLVRDTTLPLISLSQFNLPNDTTICPGENLTIGGDSNFFHYQWNTGDTTQFITISQPGTYWCMVDYGCNTYTDTMVVGNKNAAIAAFNISDTALCPGQSFTASVPAGYPHYRWSTGATTSSININSIGTYWLQVSNVCGGSYTDTIHVTDKNIPVTPFSIHDTALCPGDNFTTTGPLGYPGYLWSTGVTTPAININSIGTYWLQVSNVCGGSYTDTIHVTNKNTPVVPFDIPDTAVCLNNSYIASAPAGAEYYIWSTGATTQTVTLSNPGKYWVEIANSCRVAYTDTFAVTDKNTPVTPFDIHDTTLCIGSSFTAAAPSGYAAYIWSTGATTSAISIATAGSYSITVSNVCNTTYTDHFAVGVIDPQIDLGSDQNICDGRQRYTLSIDPSYNNILWSTGSTSANITIEQTNKYWVQAQSQCGMISDTISIIFCPPVIENMLADKATICVGECIQYTAATQNYPQQYSWTFAGGTPDNYSGAIPPTVCYNGQGAYNSQLTISNAGGTVRSDISIVVLPAPDGRFVDTVIQVPYNTEVLLPACADAVSANWYSGDTLVCGGCNTLSLQARYNGAIYTCVVQNGNCSDTCSYKIVVTDIPAGAWLPDAFTPNRDGRNDYFHIITDNPNIEVIELSVYNRWGQRVYHSDKNDKGWDGSYNGVPQESDTYYWHLQYKVINKHDVITKKGDVTLIR